MNLIIFYWIRSLWKFFDLWYYVQNFASKPWRIKFVEVDEFIWVYDGIRCLKLFWSEKYGAIYNRIIHLISQESSITYVFSHNHAKIKVDSCDSLPLEKTLTLWNVIIFIKSVFNKDKNHYYYNIF